MLIECSIAAIGAIVLSVFLIRPRDLPPVERVSAAIHLEERKRVIHEELRDLQFDFRTGKVSDTDYQAGKLSLQRDLAAVLIQIRDASRHAMTSGNHRLLTRAAPQRTRPRAVPSRDREGAVTFPLGQRTSCASCGAEFGARLKFCGNCGKAVQ